MEIASQQFNVSDSELRLHNSVPHLEGSIHSDDTARALGFETAFVPGNAVALATLPLPTTRHFDSWASAGWYEVEFVRPVHDGEPIRQIQTDSDPHVISELRSADSRILAKGRSGIGKPPVNLRYVEKYLKAEEGAFPNIKIGTQFEARKLAFDHDDILKLVNESSPSEYWANALRKQKIAPPSEILPLALYALPRGNLVLDGVHEAGMWGHQFLSFDRPFELDQEYEIQQSIICKGRTFRSNFLLTRFKVMIENRTQGWGVQALKYLRI